MFKPCSKLISISSFLWFIAESCTVSESGWSVNSSPSCVRNSFQCGIHSSPRTRDCQSPGSGEESRRCKCQVFLKYCRILQGPEKIKGSLILSWVMDALLKNNVLLIVFVNQFMWRTSYKMFCCIHLQLDGVSKISPKHGSNLKYPLILQEENIMFSFSLFCVLYVIVEVHAHVLWMCLLTEVSKVQAMSINDA